ncbi:hypothetical protein PGIGA_G00031800 [Pangasianodon gigas]|uniref:Uncharacterized protein n=1 Tax=Pangasianodon gigas TaxID=30993 RepID=A0ACC5WZ34_PANGG|nr:hypothetical protein [Pangasianodon gigas]
MTPPKEETSQEKFKREKKREGWDPGEPRHASDPEEPAGLKDSVTGRHVAQNSLQESDPETSASLLPLPETSPPSGPAETCHMASLKRCSSSSLPPEDGPTSVKQRNVSTEHSHSGIKNIPSPDQLEDAVKWNFLPDIYPFDGTASLSNPKLKENQWLRFLLSQFTGRAFQWTELLVATGTMGLGSMEEFIALLRMTYGRADFNFSII